MELTLEKNKEIKERIENYLNLIIENLNLNLNFKISLEENKININFDGKDAKLLTLKNMKILNDIQTLLIIHIKDLIDSDIKLSLDALNYKKSRNEYIEKLAQNKAREVLLTQKSYRFKPMNPFERRIIHLMFKDNEKLETISVGEEPKRSVIIKIKNKKDIYNIEEKNNFKKNGFSRKKSFGKPKRSLI